MEKYIYELKMKVRDYECDLQGIVNNANYQHYLEHTRDVYKRQAECLRKQWMHNKEDKGYAPRKDS